MNLTENNNIFTLTDDNYYSAEANKEYMSVSQYKSFAGSYGILACEYKAMEELNGNWIPEKTTPLLVGSYIDNYFEGTLDKFKEENPSIFKRDGSLKIDYAKAEDIIARIEQDKLFTEYMSGEKQVIMTGELFGSKWKIKIDSYLQDKAIVDLKVMASITEPKWVKDLGYLDFVRYWGYDIQGAIYQEVVRQNTGKQLPFYIAAATKEKETDIAVIHIEQRYLDEALSMVERNMPRVLAVKNGIAEPDKCGLCDCCRHNKVLTQPITIDALLQKI